MIEQLNSNNIMKCLGLARKLWPDMDSSVLINELQAALNVNESPTFLYRNSKGEYVAFIQLSIRRDYVEGSSSSPVAYIEGIYVEEEYRKHGLANELVQYGEVWARKMGCTEIASDCELDNQASISFHKHVGFEEAGRIVCFVKRIETV